MHFTTPAAAAALLIAAAAPPALANGFGEDRPWQFRSPAERQILLQSEQTRLNFMTFGLGGGVAGAGGQTGNSTSITITGDGDNTIDLTQDNTGNQTIQDAEGSGQNTVGGGGAAGPAPTPAAGIAATLAAFEALDAQAAE